MAYRQTGIMKGKKLFELLRALDAEEFQLLKRAVRSPLMNTNQRLVELYDCLQPFYPAFKGAGLKSGALFAHLFPGEAYNDYKLRRLLSDLSVLVKEYMVYLEATHEEERQRLLIKALGRRNLFPIFEKEARKALDGLEQAPHRGLEYYERKVEVFTRYYFHAYTDKRAIGQERLQELVHDMDYCYALAMYRVGNELRNRERIFSEQYLLDGIDAMENQYGDGILSENALFRAYRYLLKAYKDEENTGLYAQVKENFMGHLEKMGQDDQVLLFQQLLNYAIRRINQGDSSFYREALALYKTGLEAEWLMDGGRMSEATFSNIVMVCCEGGEYEWAKNFMAQYESYLDEHSREDVRAHCDSLWHYFQGHFDEALQILASHRFSGPLQLSSRMTAVRISFEQFFRDPSYYGLLFSQAKAFEKFLSRNKSLPKNRKHVHKNTLSLIKRIASAIRKQEPPDEVRQWAMEEIASEQPLVLRNWLQQQVAQLTKAPF